MDCAVELPRHSQLEFQHVATAPDHRADWRSYRRAREPALSATSTKKKKKKGQAPAESSPPSVGSMCVASFPWDVEQLLLRNCEREKLPLGGCLVRGLLTESEQQWMYETIEAHAASDSSDIATLRSTTTHETFAAQNPGNCPQAWVAWLHPYNRKSTAARQPSQLLEWANRLMHALAPGARDQRIDAMYSQLYATGGSLKRHQDEDLSWGISISLGGDALFDAFKHDNDSRPVRVRLHSGDVVVAEFGQMFHAVSVPADVVPPAWWQCVEHYGTKVRACQRGSHIRHRYSTLLATALVHSFTQWSMRMM